MFFGKTNMPTVTQNILCEAVSDITSLFMEQPQLPANSRETCNLVMDWSVEFDRQHATTDWGDDDYLEIIEAFFAQKYREWLDSTSAHSRRHNR